MNAKIQIRHRDTNAVLFECEAPDDLRRGLHMRHAPAAIAKAEGGAA